MQGAPGVARRPEKACESGDPGLRAARAHSSRSISVQP
jgi:hypothetical protein